MSHKETDALRTIVSNSLAAAAEHIRTARDAFRTMQEHKDNPGVLKELNSHIDRVLSESLFHVLTSQIVVCNVTKAMTSAKTN